LSHPSRPFRDPQLLDAVCDQLAAAAGRPLSFMHVCGTHENAIARHGLRRRLPDGLRVIAGPGCPVCVCPPADIQMAAELAVDHGAVVATFGDMLRVPAQLSLERARSLGGDVRVVLGAHQAVEIARHEPQRQVVMFAVGFETTSCTVAAAALADPPPNFSLLTSHRLIPPALAALLDVEGLDLDGFLLPGHVLTVTGLEPYAPFARRSGVPAVVAGFEPVDVMLGLRELARLAAARRGEARNAYPRAVRPGGNAVARDMVERLFTIADAAWRGLGTIPGSGLALRPEYAHLDAVQRFGLQPAADLPDDLPGCRCGEVMVGRVDPEECPLFDSGDCTPEEPRGPCMVSTEGTCRSRYLYREVP